MTAVMIDPARLNEIKILAADGHWFWSRVDISEGCWCWLGGRSGGYGVCKAAGRDERAHRVAFRLIHGAIPDGEIVCHECGNPPCVRPDHLFAGTVAINNADRAAKGRSKGTFQADETHPSKLRAGEKHWCAKLSAEAVSQIRLAREAGESVKDIAARFFVHHSTISRIARRKWRKEVA